GTEPDIARLGFALTHLWTQWNSVRRSWRRTLMPAAMAVFVAVIVSPGAAFAASGSTSGRWDSIAATQQSRLKASPGELDVSFSGDGKVTTQFASESADEAHAVAVQPDGKIVAAGESTGDFALARYTIAGTLDTSFGDGGRVQTVFDLGSD